MHPCPSETNAVLAERNAADGYSGRYESTVEVDVRIGLGNSYAIRNEGCSVVLVDVHQDSNVGIRSAENSPDLRPQLPLTVPHRRIEHARLVLSVQGTRQGGYE